ncbi:hypothetical protein GTW66_21950 [Streptomyces sp. SID5473]|uniref:hypothetical protein n=1 Tax=Streptomyces sp. SID5473 TaxID=2690299 RepID=UPI0005F7B6B7|nr:hypothetical protein [Streptomyces sp. SID5473]MYS66585.1 hypothetical protein [Streptomyces sp. SID5473]
MANTVLSGVRSSVISTGFPLRRARSPADFSTAVLAFAGAAGPAFALCGAAGPVFVLCGAAAAGGRT